MFEYIRPEWANIDPLEFSDFVMAQGLTGVSWNFLPDACYIKSETDISSVLASFAPTSTIDANLNSTYIPKVPSSAAVATHLQHLRDFRNAIRSGGAAPTLAQTQHVLADVIDALRLLDRRLDRDI